MPGPLAKLIRALREERGISQTQLAIDASASFPTISGIERGRRKASPRVLIEIAQALGRIAPLDPIQAEAFSQLTGLTPEVLVPMASPTHTMGGHGGAAAELLPLLSFALSRVGRASVEAVLRAMADPTLINTLFAAHQNTPTRPTPPAEANLIRATLHPDAGMVVREYAPTANPATPQPKPFKLPKAAKAQHVQRRRTA